MSEINKQNPAFGIDHYTEIESFYFFDDLYQFVRNSFALSLSISYMLLVFCNTTYLWVLYDVNFNVPILSLITLEDILATPLTNPRILVPFFMILGGIVTTDMANRWLAKLHRKLLGRRSYWARVVRFIFWIPKTRKNITKYTIIVPSVVALLFYVVLSSMQAAVDIKQGRGHKLELTLGNGSEKEQVSLLGVVNQLIIVYDLSTETCRAYPLDAIQEINTLNGNYYSSDG